MPELMRSSACTEGGSPIASRPATYFTRDTYRRTSFSRISGERLFRYSFHSRSTLSVGLFIDIPAPWFGGLASRSLRVVLFASGPCSGAGTCKKGIRFPFRKWRAVTFCPSCVRAGFRLAVRCICWSVRFRNGEGCTEDSGHDARVARDGARPAHAAPVRDPRDRPIDRAREVEDARGAAELVELRHYDAVHADPVVAGEQEPCLVHVGRGGHGQQDLGVRQRPHDDAE